MTKATAGASMMKLGLFLHGPGHHIAAWRDPKADPGAGMKLSHYVGLAQLGERGRFDFVFNADTQATFGPDDVNVWKRNTVSHRIEPLTLLGALAAVTKHIGLVATATTTYLEPFHVARIFASLDQLSEGRCGWNLVTSSAAAEALNFSHAAHAPHDDRYERATEFAQVVLGLWDTWEDDAFTLDQASGLFFDPAKMHMLNHKGKHFSVRGPLMISRSPQGRPVIVHAGQSDAGRALAAQAAEVVFSVEQSLEKAREFYADMKNRVARNGRSPDSIKIMPGVQAVIGRTRAEAEDKYERIQSLIHPEVGVAYLSEMLGTDISSYPLDGPLPPVPPTNSQQGRQKVIVELAQRENLTIRQLYKRVAGTRAHRTVCGTAADIADSLEHWYKSGAADGFNILSLVYPEGLVDFVEQVIPELQRRKLFRTEYEGRTLRENLGLPRPANRYVEAKRQTAAE
jgi:FMN-dependent oxidoreductase (nitrilotriacetate monooxygenase family)